MSFSRSPRFSAPIDAHLPGPADYYVKSGSIGLPNRRFCTSPSINIFKKTPIKSSQTSVPEAKTNDCTKPERLCSRKLRYDIPKSSRKQVEKKQPKQAVKPIKETPKKKSLTRDNLNDNTKIPYSLHRMLRFRRDYFRDKQTQEFLTPSTCLRENEDNNSDDEYSEPHITAKSMEIRYRVINRNLTRENIENLPSYPTHEEVMEVLKLCSKETNFLMRMDLLRLVGIHKRQNKSTVDGLMEKQQVNFSRSL